MTRMADEQTGGMIALIPRADDAQALAVPRGDKPEEMHLTLVYLGSDVSTMDNRQRNAIAAAAANVAVMLPPVETRVFGHATFNPDGHGDREPCAVYLIGDSTVLGPLRAELAQFGGDDQHEPFTAHVTAGYGIKQAKLTFTGPVVFDRLRVALGGDHYDFPLGEPMQKGLSMLEHLETKRQFTAGQRENLRKQGKTNPEGGFPLETVSDVRNAVKAFGRAKNPDQEKKRIMNAAKRLNCTNLLPDKWTGADSKSIEQWESFETKVMSPNPHAAKLREYWAHGEGRKKWRPGTPGDFKRLRRHLAKYVQNPHILDGLTANIHKIATGEWPGRSAHKDAAVITAEEFKAAMLMADADADLDLMSDFGLPEDVEDDEPEDVIDDEDEAYEQALADDFIWSINADGELERDDDAPVDDEPEEDEDAPAGPRPVSEAYSLF